MPVNSDLRAGYFKLEFNMSWFHQMMRDENKNIVFLPSNRITGTEEEREEFSERMFNEYIESKVSEFIKAKVFNVKTF